MVEMYQVLCFFPHLWQKLSCNFQIKNNLLSCDYLCVIHIILLESYRNINVDNILMKCLLQLDTQYPGILFTEFGIPFSTESIWYALELRDTMTLNYIDVSKSSDDVPNNALQMIIEHLGTAHIQKESYRNISIVNVPFSSDVKQLSMQYFPNSHLVCHKWGFEVNVSQM